MDKICFKFKSIYCLVSFSKKFVYKYLLTTCVCVNIKVCEFF